MGQLDSKVAIVTGANSGIGRATALLFAQEGAAVIVSGRRQDLNEQVAAEITAAGGTALALRADVSVPWDCRRLVDETVAAYGRIDVLVNNAGIADRHLPIDECSEDWFDQVTKVDQYSVFSMSKYALEYMAPVGEGSIVNVSSIGAGGVAGISYSAAKAAVNAMTKNIAIRYAATGIRCNAIAPGPTPTPLNAPEAASTFHQEFAAMTAEHLDLTVPEATPEDQAQAILWFASDASKAVTGQILYVDHGTSLY
ncbi:MAG: SDR family oxidoreductase [Propionicimonas sp.]|uniref:SDR family NAD(P)-dependent oxidoreductase n=1 Tax=Propionicimonas sp. TaxID=1955623 RepID=UPI002B1EE8B9|nr:SDR family oxidoreductase [Propionicimonas sp.]MEA4944007.1 SDR family oxidoreductase [Propionicimonas sp.]MEA5055853.1 SDR family oxidoreductase [Propionicimonas sp.]MEA5119199.1 SDR family oxidoreductase [Propionicimonas sp.]